MYPHICTTMHVNVTILKVSVKESGNVIGDISIVALLDDCKENASLYTALRLEENGFNITEMTDLNQYGFYNELDTLKNTSFEIDEVSVLHVS